MNCIYKIIKNTRNQYNTEHGLEYDIGSTKNRKKAVDKKSVVDEKKYI